MNYWKFSFGILTNWACPQKCTHSFTHKHTQVRAHTQITYNLYFCIHFGHFTFWSAPDTHLYMHICNGFLVPEHPFVSRYNYSKIAIFVQNENVSMGSDQNSSLIFRQNSKTAEENTKHTHTYSWILFFFLYLPFLLYLVSIKRILKTYPWVCK